MIGWWSLDETSGSTALDLTGYMGQPFNNGTTQQGPLASPNSPDPVAGLVDGGFHFDGIDDYVDIPHHSSLNLGTGDFTLDMWIYAETPTADQMPLFSKFDSDRGFAFSLLQWSATEYRMQLHIGDGTAEFLHSAPFVLSLQTWKHLAVTVDRTTGLVSFYLDGVLHGTETMSTTGSISNMHPAYIARHPDIVSVWFTGIIDEVELFSRALSGAEILSIVQAGADGKCKPLPPQCVQPPAGMIGWWALDETSGSTTVDLTGYMGQPFNDGTTQQGPLGTANSPEAVAGQVDGGFYFSSEHDFVEISHDPSLDVGADDFTIDLWFYREETQDMMPLFSKTGADGGYALSIQFWGGSDFRYRLDLDDGVTSDMILGPTHPSPANTWIHLTAVVDRQNSQARFYVDGTLHDTQPITITGSVDNTDRAYIAFDPNFDASFLVGVIDEVELFNRALSPSEIQDIAAAGPAGKCKPAEVTECVEPPADMLGWWPLDETSGSTAIDLTGLLGQPYNDGTTQQGPLGTANSPEAVAGQVDGAFRFQDEQDYVEIPHDASLNVGADDFTVDLWFYREDVSDVMPLFGKSSTGAGFAFSLQFAGGGNFFYRLDLHDGVLSDMVLGPVHASPANQWIHATAVVDRQNGEARFYVDGGLHATLPITVTGSLDNTEPAHIAFDPNFAGNAFTGAIDEVELFGRALSASEIHGIASAGSFGKCKPKDTASEHEPRSPGAHQLSVYPNPSTGQVTISFVMTATAEVEVTVYDLVGRRVAAPVGSVMMPGRHEMEVSLDGLPSGVYVIRLSDQEDTSVRAITVIR